VKILLTIWLLCWIFDKPLDRWENGWKDEFK
jgi:hypothetical protein